MVGINPPTRQRIHSSNPLSVEYSLYPSILVFVSPVTIYLCYVIRKEKKRKNKIKNKE
jgi:hypothetical protein